MFTIRVQRGQAVFKWTSNHYSCALPNATKLVVDARARNRVTRAEGSAALINSVLRDEYQRRHARLR